MKKKQLLILSVLFCFLASCGNYTPSLIEPTEENPSINDNSSSELTIDENLLVEVKIDNIYPAIDLNLEEEPQENFTYEIINEGISITSYKGSAERFSIPSIFEIENTEYSVIEIGSHAFAEINFIKEIVLPEGIKSLKEYSFYKCSSLENIELPSTLERIENAVFSEISNLQSICLPLNLSFVGYDVFSATAVANGIFVEASEPGSSWKEDWEMYEYHLYNRVIWGVKGFAHYNNMTFLIADETSLFFYTPNNLSELIVPSCLKINENKYIVSTINRNAFKNNDHLKTIILSYGIEKIESEAFKNSSIEKINLPETINAIGVKAFNDCVYLKEFAIPQRVISLSNALFENCTSLEKVILHDKVSAIGSDVFNYCKNLKYIVIPSSVSVMKKAFLYCNQLKIYVDLENQPDSWESNWNWHNCEVYWKNGWIYEGNTPTPIVEK